MMRHNPREEDCWDQAHMERPTNRANCCQFFFLKSWLKCAFLQPEKTRGNEMEAIQINSMASTKPNFHENITELEFESSIPNSKSPEYDELPKDSTNDGTQKMQQSNSEEMEKVGEMGKKITFIFWGKFQGVKRVVEDRWLRFNRGGDDLETTRVYQVWPGKNVFFFRGRFIFGPDPRGLLLSIVSIIISSWIFTFYDGDDFSSRSNLIIAFSTILTITVLANLILVATTDPGIIPRNDRESVEEVGTCKGSKRKTLMVNGVELKLKYCKTCRIFRQPRSCHCAVCDNCVEKFDHHCPWIGQCIGLRNYRYYLACLCTALGFFVYVFSFSCWRIHRKIVNGFVWIARNCPETLALASFSIAAIGFLGGLIIFHIYLISINQTAYENFRQRYASSKNPYNRGILRNMKEVLLVPLPSSRVDFRAQVMPR